MKVLFGNVLTIAVQMGKRSAGIFLTHRMMLWFISALKREFQEKNGIFLLPREGDGAFAKTMFVTYNDTQCFALGFLRENEHILPKSFITLVIIQSGTIIIGQQHMYVDRGEKIFVPYNCGEICSISAKAIVCYPPEG